MISYAYRYAPIWQTLIAQHQPASGVLEVGSGAEGLALFWKAPLVSVDLRFKRRPIGLGVQASTLSLPFSVGSFPVVVSCDMLEHLPAAQRKLAVLELARVSGRQIMLGFPSGAAAVQLYQELGQSFKGACPDWLQEHLALGLPDAAEVAGWLREAGWQVEVSWYESARMHKRLVSLERNRAARWCSYLLTRSLGRFLIAGIASGEQTVDDPMRVLLLAKIRV